MRQRKALSVNRVSRMVVWRCGTRMAAPPTNQARQIARAAWSADYPMFVGRMLTRDRGSLPATIPASRVKLLCEAAGHRLGVRARATLLLPLHPFSRSNE